jgi:hypothetical protein
MQREHQPYTLSLLYSDTKLITLPPRRPFPSLQVLYKYKVLNTPDKTVLSLIVTFPPGASTPSHTHASAFVAVHVLTSSVLNKMNDDPMTRLRKRETASTRHPGADIGLVIMRRRQRRRVLLLRLLWIQRRWRGLLGRRVWQG